MDQNETLKTKFYDAYDASALTNFLAKMASISENERRSLPNFLGEGMHFQSFEIGTVAMPLAVNVAKASFIHRGDAAIDRWKRAMRRATSLEGATMIPPMDIIQTDGLLAIIMPMGRTVPRTGTKLIDTLLHETAKILGHAGLVLDDYPQVREAFGVPFIIDWSDLGFIQNQETRQ